MNVQQYYTLFQIDPTATQDDIKKAYRRLAIRFHPDTGGSQAEFLLVQEAYGWLQKYHVPQKPKAQPQKFEGVTLYRVIHPVWHDLDQTWKMNITVPEYCNKDQKVQLMCMWEMLEFRIVMDQTVVFPITVDVTGLPRKLRLTIWELYSK